MKNFIAWLKNEESGQGMVEYGLIIALIAAIIIAVVAILKKPLTDKFTAIGSSISTAGN